MKTRFTGIMAMMLLVMTALFGGQSQVKASPSTTTPLESYQLKAGETKTVSAGWSCAADLREKMADGKMVEIMSDGTEVVEFNETTNVFAEWGGYCLKAPATKFAELTKSKPADHLKLYFPQTHMYVMDSIMVFWMKESLQDALRFYGYPQAVPITYTFTGHSDKPHIVQKMQKTYFVDHPERDMKDPYRVETMLVDDMMKLGGVQTSTQAPEAPMNTDCKEDHFLAAGEVYLAHKGCTAKGDIMVWTGPASNTPPTAGPESPMWKKMYLDCRPELNGNMVVFSENTWVRTEGNWGANVDPHNYCYLLEVDMHQMGCGSHCDSVTTWYWPKGK